MFPSAGSLLKGSQLLELGPDGSQELGPHLRFSGGWQGPKGLRSFLLLPRTHISQKPEVGTEQVSNPGTLLWDMGILSGVLITVPSAHPGRIPVATSWEEKRIKELVTKRVPLARHCSKCFAFNNLLLRWSSIFPIGRRRKLRTCWQI